MPDMTPQARAQASFSIVLRKMPHGSGNLLAEAMNLSAKDLSEIKNKMVEPSLLLLAHLGYKIVPVSAKCLTPVAYEFLTDLQQRVSQRAPSLQWEDSDHSAATQPWELGA